MTSDVLTVDEAAARARVSKKTIYRALEKGALLGSKVGAGPEAGAVWRIFDADLEAWLISLRPPRDATATTSPRRSPRGRRRRGDLRALDQRLEGSSS